MNERIIDYIEYWAENTPDHIALIYDNKNISYKTLYERSYKYAKSLLELGVTYGDRIAYILDCCPQFFYLYLGASIIGASVTGINTRSPLNEIRRLTDVLNVKLVLCNKCSYKDELCLNAICLEMAEFDSITNTYNMHGSDISKIDYLRGCVEEDTTVFVVFTSGTTGVPKGAILSQKSIITSVKAQIHEFGAPNGLTINDIIQHHVPISHVSGTVQWGVAPLVAGCTLILHSRFNAEKVIENTERYHATILTGVPSMWELMFRIPSFKKYDLSSVRWCATGAAPISKDLAERIFDICDNVSNPLGMTETSGFCSMFQGVSSLDDVVNTVGKIIPEIEYQILDETGRKLAIGEIGQLVYRGESIIKGYINADLNRNESGYYLSGDLAFEDENGRIHMCGRKDDMFTVGGSNVYPEEIERLLLQYPNIKMAAVIPYNHHTMVNICKALVILNEKNSPLNMRKLINYLEDNILYYKIPRDIIVVENLPTNALGKIDRKACQRILSSEKGLL